MAFSLQVAGVATPAIVNPSYLAVLRFFAKHSGMSTTSTDTPRPHLATLDDILAIPEDERFHEVLDGELMRKARAGGEHGLTHFAVSSLLGSHFRRRPNGAERPGGWWFTTDTEVELAAHQAVRPDIAGWRRTRLPDKPAGFPLRLRPDWVCEVMTDGDARRRDGVQKRRIYADYLVPHYWLLDTQRQTLTVLRLEERGYVDLFEAGIGERVRAEPFDAIELQVGGLFGEDAD